MNARAKLLDALRRGGFLSPAALAHRCGLSVAAAYRVLGDMERRGEIALRRRGEVVVGREGVDLRIGLDR